VLRRAVKYLRLGAYRYNLASGHLLYIYFRKESSGNLQPESLAAVLPSFSDHTRQRNERENIQAPKDAGPEVRANTR
jgi:hypothetical protein